VKRAALKPLPRAPLLHVSVQQSLKQFINDNRLAGGDPLPPEAALAKALGVSRNSVREAVKGLESLGILETRRGVGVFVQDFSLEPLLEHLTYGLDRGVREIADILEVRRSLEVAMVECAMARLTKADLTMLRGTVDAMRAHAERGESFAVEDRAFHNQLFRALENRVMLRLIDVFWLAFHKASGFFDMENPDPMATWQDHADILAAVEADDPEAARARLDHHYRGIAGLLALREQEQASP
jgi:DNA-binding FadR family transcriptional regulator